MSQKKIIFILAVLLFLNATSLNISRSVGTFNMISYVLRIFIYFYVAWNVLKTNYPEILRRSYYYRFNVFVSGYLIINILFTYLWTNRSTSISVPFPTLFVLADNALFLYIGYYLANKPEENKKVIKLLWWFAVISIFVMTVLSIRIRLKYGSLVELWGMVRRGEGDSLGVMLNAYKNSFPYKFAVLIPFLFLRKNKFNVYLTILCVANILLVGKKGPLLSLAIAALVVFLFSFRHKRRYIVYAGYAVLMFLLYFTLIDDSIFTTLEYRLNPARHWNVDDTTSFYLSGRDHIWKVTMDGFYRSSFTEKIFGHGTIGVVSWLVPRGMPGNAHNTWLEILYNYGIAGAFVFFTYYCYLIKMYFRMRRDRYEYTDFFLFLLVIPLVTMMFSVTIYGGFASMGYCGLLCAFLLGRYISQYQKFNYNQFRKELINQEYGR
ncbi:MAG: O-antigen ligase family protein [Prevotella sp.]|nr:O-antigen ligase family protein [Prevotella sp.]